MIDDEVSDFDKATFERILESYPITLIEWNHNQGHIYISFKAQPKTEWSKFINAYKTVGSRLIKQYF